MKEDDLGKLGNIFVKQRKKGDLALGISRHLIWLYWGNKFGGS